MDCELKSKKLSVLGCTGSIGTNTLDVIRKLEPRFQVAALACRSNVERLLHQVEEFSPEAVAVTGQPNPEAEAQLNRLHGTRVYRGEQGLLRMIEETDAELVVNGISGAKGLLPSIKTLQLGIDLALANKETIVMAGPLVRELSHRYGSRLLPVDSEHHGLFSLLRERKQQDVREIILTASGGAFRDLTYEQLRHVSVEDAVTHPNWNMGAKITVDSATMANKGLEVIEAFFLFDIPLNTIKVLIHPQSYVHALIRTIDGFLYAQISRPDMRLPIQDALTYPDLESSPLESFDLAGKSLQFDEVDPRKYRLLPLAYEAAGLRGGYPIAYNAANEVGVERFLERDITFLEISGLVERVLQSDWGASAETVEQILQIDRRAREKAVEILNE